MDKLRKLLKNKHKEIVASLVFIVSLCIFSFSYAFAVVDPVRSITITSNNTNYENKEEGSWQVTKSGYWKDYGEAEVTLDVDTSLMESNQYTDIIFVLDISDSMDGDKLNRVKKDSKELISSLLSSHNNKAALITFESNSQIVSDLTNDEELLINKIDSLRATGMTNYYQALENVDNILRNYQKESDEKIIVLFLTDGYPNINTPNQISEYNYLKSAYPYITINGIQYEMGSSILNPIKEISDNQFIADMETLNNVLFNASVDPITYETYQIIDYIDNDNFILNSKDDINVSQGTVELTEENGKQKFTWTLDGLASGREANLTMKLRLKEELLDQGGIYPTNESTKVISKIENQAEDVTTTQTPILADNYTVSYDGNAPEGCSVSNVPDFYNYSVHSTVKVSDTVPTCNGYQFNGWEIVTKDIIKINDDYFTMPEKDVVIKAEWSKLSTTKTMDGEMYVAPTLYNFMKQDAVMDNTSSEFVSSPTGINFSNISSDTNGKGVYTRAGTEDNEYPIMYFRGDVDNNHVKFGGFCWDIVRTTETGGTKLIYDGIPDVNGYCQNSGDDSQIGESAFNQSYYSPSDVGYMVGTRYESSFYDIPSWVSAVGKTVLYYPTSAVGGSNYYYADSVSYSDGTYTLLNPFQYRWDSYNTSPISKKYTCLTNDTSCSTIYYVNNASYSGVYTVVMENGETFDNLIATTDSWIYGNDVVWNGSSYTLVDTVESNQFKWRSDRTSVIRNGHRYTCMSNSDTCSTVYYVFWTSSSIRIYYIPLNDSMNITGVLNAMFPEDSNLRNQTDSTIKTTIDNWYSNNMIEYTKYLEDTVWCNDRSIYQKNGWDKDYSDSDDSLYFGSYKRYSDYTPSTECSVIADSFTVSSETGNGKLTYPVALLTMDEVNMAGGTEITNDSYYLYTGSYWATISPYGFDSSNQYFFEVGYRGRMEDGAVFSSIYGIRPSISLQHDLLVARGDGTSENPYELVLE